MLQIDDTVRSGYEKVIIVSPDTDSFVTAYTIIQNGYINIYALRILQNLKEQSQKKLLTFLKALWIAIRTM